MLRKLNAYRRLGLRNIFKVFWYRTITSKRVIVPSRSFEVSDSPVFFLPPSRQTSLPASSNWDRSQHAFGWFRKHIGDHIPTWHEDAFGRFSISQANGNWNQIPDFSGVNNDIKCVWEASRFDWVLSKAQRATTKNAAAGRIVADYEDLRELNRWLADWKVQNPPFKGPNWKCGQEASLRLIHLATALLVMNRIEGKPFDFANLTPHLADLIELHIDRVRPTIDYAIAQDNNHALSEAVALYIGGTLLENAAKKGNFFSKPNNFKKVKELGRMQICECVTHLFEPTGTFSQHSVNYHRFALDLLSIAEIWRNLLCEDSFTVDFYNRAASATQWLAELVEPADGDAPNIGANDGARILPLTDTDYRDFRPSVQLAMNLFCRQRFMPENGNWDNPCKWLGVLPQKEVWSGSRSAVCSGGFLTKSFYRPESTPPSSRRSKAATIVFRYPDFKFRPSHADSLHVDLWAGGINLLRDGGSFSYNTNARIMDYYSGVESHNTIQFDKHDQMPRVSRFLYGAWTKASNFAIHRDDDDELIVECSYRHWKGPMHTRKITCRPDNLHVEDIVSGFKDTATIRWRLPVESWTLTGTTAHCPFMEIAITATTAIKRIEIVPACESRYYQLESPIEVLVAELSDATTIHSRLRWTHGSLPQKQLSPPLDAQHQEGQNGT